MKIEFCSFDGFKNLENCVIKPVKNLNLIYGKNAQGKTNFLEAIHLFSGNMIRHSKNSNLINFEKNFADLKLNFTTENFVHKARIFLGKKNKFLLNGVKYLRLNEFCGKFFSVFFSPYSLQIIEGSPNHRRKFLDSAISQLQPNYLKYIKLYDRVLFQRNKILKSKNFNVSNMLEIFSQQLSKFGTIISIYRQDYILKISKFVSEIYDKISNNGEKLKISYCSNVFSEPLNNKYDSNKQNFFFEKLKASIELDSKLGFTCFGVHKDDLNFEVDGLNLKNYGSQGQKKTCAVSLKLAQTRLIDAIFRKKPVILLDEVLSELDEFRQEFMLNFLRNNQVFVSCCNKTQSLNLERTKVFVMNSGKISSLI